MEIQYLLNSGVGAAVVFCQRFVKLASKPVLAGGLSFSAGIMLYVSFIEILGLCQKFHLIGVLLDPLRQRGSAFFKC